MQALIAHLRRDWMAYAVILIAAAIQVVLATRSLDFLITNVLPDDAFYYFQIARNIVEGLGSTFDGVEPTNGYHALWLVVLIGIFTFVQGALAPIQVALGLSIVANILTALFVLALISRFATHPAIRAFALLLWSLNPFVLFETINGLETSFALLCTSAFFYFALKSEGWQRTTSYALLGALAGLMILARLDMAFYFAAFLVLVLYREQTMRGFTKVVVAGLTATVLVLPWLLWNSIGFGMLLTSASQANSLVGHTLVVQDHGTSLLQLVKAIIYNVDYQIRAIALHTGTPGFIFMLLGGVLVLWQQKLLALPKRLQEISIPQALFVGFCAIFFINVVLRFTGRPWYFVSIGIFLSLLAAVVATRIAPTRILSGAVLLFVLFTFGVSWSKELKDQYVNQREMYAAALWINEHLPSTAVVGAFNTGIQGYYSNVRVVNLDGLVNNAAYEAMRDRSLWAYMEGQGITHVIDFDIYLTYRYRSFFGIDDYMERLVPVTHIAYTAHSRSENGISVYEMPAR